MKNAGKERPNLDFRRGDIFKLFSELEEAEGQAPKFSCVVDKGTLDAIHSGGISEDGIKNYFDQVTSVIPLFGKYLLVTLAQEHIVHSIAAYFLSK